MPRIRKNDTVLVTTGKDQGKQGKVHRVIPGEERALVEGINISKRHTKARPGVRQAGIVEREAPIHISNLMLVCPNCQRATRVGFRFLEDGAKIRVCKRCGEHIT